MKKYLLLFIFLAFYSNAQTGLFNEIKVTGATKKNDATRMVLQDSLTKKYHWMLKNNFLYSESAPAMLQGGLPPASNPIVSAWLSNVLPRNAFYLNNTTGTLYTYDFGSSDWVVVSGGGTTPTLQEVTVAGASTDQPVTFEDGATVQGDLFHKNNDGFIAEDIITGLTGNRTYTKPNVSGTYSLISNFINDDDTTHSPDGNTVFDALSLKANDADVLHTTGNSEIILPIDNGTDTAELLADPYEFYYRNANVTFLVTDYTVNVQTVNSGEAARLKTTNLTTASRDYEFPDASGTLALSENTVNLTGNQVLNGTKDFISGVTLSNSTIFIDDEEANFNIVNKFGDVLYEFAGNNNYTAVISSSGLTANRNFSLVDAAGQIPVVRTTAPTSSTATGVKGEIYVDASYIYYCYDTNLWRRVAGSTF